jgi:sugar lactone lactonase YvrE
VNVIVPAEAEGGQTAVRFDESPGETAYLEVARSVATGVHQVDSPAFGSDGRVFCTMSGGRGQPAAVPLYRIAADGSREPLQVEIANPTSLAVGPDSALYVSSRFDGQVYRVIDAGHAEIYATELGTPTGLAFDSDGALFVGDRSGSILRVSPQREVETFATLPPSVAAYHLAMGPDRCLYVSVQTLSTHDAIHRVRPDRTVEIAYAGFGRPQGLAFDSKGFLYVVEALAGAAGLYRFDPAADAKPELVLSAASLIGVAFDPSGGMLVCSSDTIWRIDCDLQPLRLHAVS